MKGVGPQLGALFSRFFGTPEGQEAIVLDVLMHMPSGVIDRRAQNGVAFAPVGSIATLKLHIDEHIVPPRGNNRAPLRVKAHDETGEITLIFFGAKGGWVERSLPIGETRYVSGEIGFFGREKQITHPDYIVEPDRLDTLPLVEPVYPLTHGLSSKALRKVVASALDSIPIIPEWIGKDRRTIMAWPGFADALRHVHAPRRPSEGDIVSPARLRLAYDEYLAGQLALNLVRSTLIKAPGVARKVTGEMTERVEDALPFALTDGQRLAVSDIRDDLAKPTRMSRLLQGDVGSGKTVVALMAMAAVAEGGAQSALMAPTELLASQHFRTLQPIAEKAGLRIVLMTGKMPAAERRKAVEGLASGAIHIAVGTHALFQAGVEFLNLGLTVVDEQHRFGVHQRLALSEKGHKTDLLVMTATPIPRTLVLTHFGDMDVSVLREKPAGRQPIDTAALPIAEYERVLARLKSRFDEGVQAYWVCPLVEESEVLDVVSAEDRYAELKKTFGDKVALVHGRMSGAEKQAAMERFQIGDAQILVATTVIEVGVDVPDATIIIIEHAERFGLAQLHQLRGRVGRGVARSACLLLYSEPLSETAKARIETICRTDDGFEIAEKDLELRGHGDLLGTRQSGMPGYRIAVPDVHSHLLEIAHNDARAALDRNPGLRGPEGEALRILLYIFRKDLAIPLIKAG
nr:ATP-dependent DNA helicase RecG [Pelagibacterium limicola]